MRRIGIDVGGTNTDAVLMDGAQVLAAHKATTTPDVTEGIARALAAVLENAEPRTIDAVMLGTTHFINAIVERRGLSRVAVVRLCGPATRALPPLVDWPEDLAGAVRAPHLYASGGREFDGRQITPVDESQLRRIAGELRERGITQAAVVGVFAPVLPEDEDRAAVAMHGLDVTVSHRVGHLNFLARENATIFNAALRPLARRTIDGFRRALADRGLHAPLYLTQNDGTLMNAEFAAAFPILTFSSGRTNSMRGAAFLSGLTDAIVVDIGGTTTDVGALVAGFPREAHVALRVGGVRTNFRMPDVLSIGLGGGSIVRDGGARVGPDSVAYRLEQEALCFGGATATATDIAVASGLAKVGTEGVALPAEVLDRARATIRATVEQTIDRMKLSSADVPVVLVGGGSILVEGNLAGASCVVRPPHGAVANAVGAAIAQASGEVDRVFSLAATTREQAIADATAHARRHACEAGAREETLRIADIDVVPLSYLPGNAARIRVKAVGEL